MSLLSNLTLDYEILADDPIEVSIRYGKSVLGSIAQSVGINPLEQTPAKPRHTVESSIEFRPFQSRQLHARQQRSAAPPRQQTIHVARRDFINYAARPISVIRQQRDLVGAL